MRRIAGIFGRASKGVVVPLEFDPTSKRHVAPIFDEEIVCITGHGVSERVRMDSAVFLAKEIVAALMQDGGEQ